MLLSSFIRAGNCALGYSDTNVYIFSSPFQTIMIEICTVGGYNEVGRNCTAVRVDDEVVLFDLGLQLDKYITYTEERDDVKVYSPKKMVELVLCSSRPFRHGNCRLRSQRSRRPNQRRFLFRIYF